MISVSGARSSASAEGKPSTRTAASLAYTSEPSGPWAVTASAMPSRIERRSSATSRSPSWAARSSVTSSQVTSATPSIVSALTRSVRTPRGRVARHGGAAQALAAGGAHGGQMLLGERAAVGVAAAIGREPGGGGAADGVVAAQLARGAVGGEHAAGAGLDGHDRGRDSVQHRIRPADLGSARRGR